MQPSKVFCQPRSFMSSSTSRHGQSSHDTITVVGVVVPVVVAVVVPHALQAAWQISATRVPKKVCAQISSVRLDDEKPRDLHMSGSVVPLQAVIVVADVVVVVAVVAVVTVAVVEVAVVEVTVLVVVVTVVEVRVSVVEVAVVVVLVTEVVVTEVVVTVVLVVVVDGKHMSHDNRHKEAVFRNIKGSIFEYSGVHINLRLAHSAGSGFPLHVSSVVDVTVAVVVVVSVVEVTVVTVVVRVVESATQELHSTGHSFSITMRYSGVMSQISTPRFAQTSGSSRPLQVAPCAVLALISSAAAQDTVVQKDGDIWYLSRRRKKFKERGKKLPKHHL